MLGGKKKGFGKGVKIVLEVEFVSSQNLCAEALAPVPQNGTLFGDHIIVDIISKVEVILKYGGS